MKFLIDLTMKVALFFKNKIFSKFIKKELLDKLINEETITYILFGVLTTLLNIVVFAFLQWIFKIGKYASIILMFNNCVAWVAGVIFAYYTNKKYVFKSVSATNKEMFGEFMAFVVARITSLVVDCLGLYILVTLLTANDLVAKIIMNIVVVILNYFFSKLFIFKSKDAV